MLIPDRGASTVMNNATKAPEHSPVNRAILGTFETRSTTVKSPSEIRNSARKAMSRPSGPGRVIAYLTAAWLNVPPSATAARNTPTIAPTNCATM
jgi:hypothetical protein